MQSRACKMLDFSVPIDPPVHGTLPSLTLTLDLEVVPTPVELATHLHPRPLGDDAEHLVVAVVPASFRWW